MRSPPPSGEDPHPLRHRGAPRTLGDLLHAGMAKGPLSEEQCVGFVRAIAAGDQRALHAVYARTYRLVFTLMVRITNNGETAEELTVDVFHDVWRRASTYDPANGSVVGWIMNQARSRAIDRLRFDQRQKRVNHRADTPPPAVTTGIPDDTFALQEQGARLRQALTVLTPGERQAIETAFFSELTYHEVAAQLNQPIGTTKTRIRSGLSKLRHALAKTVKEP